MLCYFSLFTLVLSIQPSHVPPGVAIPSADAAVQVLRNGRDA